MDKDVLDQVERVLSRYREIEDRSEQNISVKIKGLLQYFEEEGFEEGMLDVVGLVFGVLVHHGLNHEDPEIGMKAGRAALKIWDAFVDAKTVLDEL